MTRPLNGSEAGGDLVLIQTSLLLLCNWNEVVLMLTRCFYITNHRYVSNFTAVKRLGMRVIKALPVTFPFHHTNFPRSTSASRAISILSPIILPLQTFFSRVLLLRQQAFSSRNLLLAREADDSNYHDYNTSLHVSGYEHVNSTKKFKYREDTAKFKSAGIFDACLFLWKCWNPFPRALYRARVA